MKFWYCLIHHSVEPNDGCADSMRLGPFPTRADAELALDRARSRNESWDEDERWHDEEADA